MNQQAAPGPGPQASSSDPHNIPTPPVSPPSDHARVSVSTTFLPSAQIHPSSSDIVLLSCDSVFFYVHTEVLLAASQNSFDSLLPPAGKSLTHGRESVISVPERSEVLNVVLHASYNLSCARYVHTLPTLSEGISALIKYGINLHECIRPSTPLFSVLLAHAPAAPIGVYALAAQHDLQDLAVSASPHLLSFSLPSLTDEMAQAIGPIYLKRLFFLHLGRIDALRRLLLSPPHPHTSTPECDFSQQKGLTRAWALATAYLAWDARPDMPGSTLKSALEPLGEDIRCDKCREALQERIRTLIVQWSVVKRTI